MHCEYFIESFNGTFRDECFNAHWFESLQDARMQIEAWRREYNESRSHRTLGEFPPAEFARRFSVSSASDVAKGTET
jgi:putative transposase